VGGLIAFNIAVSIVVIIVLQFAGMFIFSLMTPFNDMEELKKGNTAVGLAMGGKFVATAIILGVSAFTNTSILHMVIWFCVGYLCLILTYWIFEWVTPGIKISDELQKGNNAIGVLLCLVYIGISLAVCSLIV
jgi:putative membrane protein